MNDLYVMQQQSSDCVEEINALLSQALAYIRDMEHDTAEKKEQCKELFRQASDKTAEEYIEYIRKSEFEKAYKLSRKLNVLAKQIQQLAMRHKDSYLYMMGFFDGTFNACKNSMSRQSEEAVFTVEMSKIISQKHVREILEYLYDHDYTQNKKLCNILSVKPNLLHKKLEFLINSNCILRYPDGKYVFYSLSEQGRKYVKNILGYKKSEVIDTAYYCSVDYKKVQDTASHEYDSRLYDKEYPLKFPGRDRISAEVFYR